MTFRIWLLLGLQTRIAPFFYAVPSKVRLGQFQRKGKVVLDILTWMDFWASDPSFPWEMVSPNSKHFFGQAVMQKALLCCLQWNVSFNDCYQNLPFTSCFGRFQLPLYVLKHWCWLSDRTPLFLFQWQPWSLWGKSPRQGLLGAKLMSIVLCPPIYNIQNLFVFSDGVSALGRNHPTFVLRTTFTICLILTGSFRLSLLVCLSNIDAGQHL